MPHAAPEVDSPGAASEPAFSLNYWGTRKRVWGEALGAALQNEAWSSLSPGPPP
jgi:hypothetical protein